MEPDDLADVLGKAATAVRHLTGARAMLDELGAIGGPKLRRAAMILDAHVPTRLHPDETNYADVASWLRKVAAIMDPK